MKWSATPTLMRKINRAAVLDLVRREGPLARSEIARRLDTSLPTVMRVVAELVEEDLVTYSGTSESTGGRPPMLLAFNGTAYAAVGVDLGGSKIFGAVADLTGHIQHDTYVRWEDEEPDHYLEALCELVEQLIDAPRPRGQQIRGIGVGAPGVTVTPEGIVTWAPSFGWRDLPLQDILSERFEMPVFVENDVNLAALGEYGFGAGRGVRDLVCVSVGTGVGAGIIIDGILHQGHDHAAGEIGYLLPGVGYISERYDSFGALESVASATGIVKRANELLGQTDSSTVVDGWEDVFDAARKGVEWARQVVDETVDYLSLAIASVCTVVDPEIVILGGGVARSEDLLIDSISQRLEGRIPRVPPILASQLGRRAAVMGAIMLVLYGTTQQFIVRQLP
jgi:glucokinase-like ROK family protein